jgi:hypothetical protein
MDARAMISPEYRGFSEQRLTGGKREVGKLSYLSQIHVAFGKVIKSLRISIFVEFSLSGSAMIERTPVPILSFGTSFCLSLREAPKSDKNRGGAANADPFFDATRN